MNSGKSLRKERLCGDHQEQSQESQNKAENKQQNKDYLSKQDYHRTKLTVPNATPEIISQWI